MFIAANHEYRYLYSMEPKDLTQMPNIGITLANKLVQVEIKTPVQLLETGSQNAFLRLKTIDPETCINTLFALEGAIQNIRWHQLSSKTKEELRSYFHLTETGIKHG